MISVIALCAGLAAAPSPGDIKQAKASFEAAERDYRLGNFQEALAHYREAYRLYPRAEFLFNIGQSQRGLQQWREAAFSFELYLRDAPDADDAAKVRDLILQMKARAKRAEEVSLLPPVAAAPPPPDPPMQVGLRQPEVGEEPVYKKWWFWTAVGAVVVAGAATGIVVATQNTATPSGSLGTFDYR